MRGFLDRVQCDQPGAVPMMTVMRHQGRDCNGRYLAGGPAEDRRTMKWYDDFAAAVGDSRVVIAFEPDSLGTSDCLAPHRRPERLRMLAHGVDVLSQLPKATVYLEAGASDWEPAERTAKQLRIIGIRKVRGFMLNVTHHDWTRNNIRHGLDLSRRVGGKPFIVNTSYNGRGPLHYKRWINRSQGMWRRVNVWCHPGTRPRSGAHHGHLPPARGRLHVRQSARLLGGGMQRRAAADRHLVARAGADVRRERDQLGGRAGGHQARPLQALLATRPRRLRLEQPGARAPGPPLIPGRDRGPTRRAQAPGPSGCG